MTGASRDRRQPWNPYRRLAAAVLWSAVSTIRRKRGKVRAEAAEWLMSEDAEGWAAFTQIDITSLRRVLRKKGLLT